MVMQANFGQVQIFGIFQLGTKYHSIILYVYHVLMIFAEIGYFFPIFISIVHNIKLTTCYVEKVLYKKKRKDTVYSDKRLLTVRRTAYLTY